MDKENRKQLVREYLDRKPKMGIIALKCKSTGEEFVQISKDTKADFNSNTFQLKMGSHPNKGLQKLWNAYKEDGFSMSVPLVLKYDDPKADHKEKLEGLLNDYLAQHEDAKMIK